MNNIEKYFHGEKWQCTIGIIYAIVCISISIYFLFLQKPMLKGMAYAILPLSALLLIVCIGIVVRTPKDVVRVTTNYQSGAHMVKAKELPRMEKVMKSFSLLKTIELVLFLAGIVFGLIFWSNPLVRGICIGLMVQCSFLYLFDYTAAMRGKAYVDFLQTL